MATQSQRVDQFLLQFNQVKSSLSDKFKSLDQDSYITQDEKNTLISSCSDAVSNLKELYQESAFLLPAYTQKRSLEAIKSLENELAAAKQSHKEQKKFSFKKSSGPAKSHAKSDETVAMVDDTIHSSPIILRENETIILPEEETIGRQVSVSDAKNCVIHIKGTPRSVQIRNLDSCEVTCDPVTAAVAVHQVTNSKLRLIGQQLRLTDCRSCALTVYVSTRIAIEGCKELTISPIDETLRTSLANEFPSVGLDAQLNNWRAVDDFDWQFALPTSVGGTDPEVTNESPNYKLVDPK